MDRSIWKAKNLRHLYMTGVSIRKPSSKESSTSTSKLETLTGLVIGSEEESDEENDNYRLDRFTALRKLGLTCHSKSVEKTVEYISLLDKLETLKLRSRDLRFGQPSDLVLSPLKDRQTLSKLHLFGLIKDGIHNLSLNLKILALSMSELTEDVSAKHPQPFSTRLCWGGNKGQPILGPDSGWQRIPLAEVITSAAVKKAYRKATLCVHPDKLQQRGASVQQKYICEKVFDLLKSKRRGQYLLHLCLYFDQRSTLQLLTSDLLVVLLLNYFFDRISRASLMPELTHITKPAASWLDDFLVWMSPEAFGCCRKFVDGSYCPPDDQCFLHSDLDDGRSSTAQFKEKLPWFLNALPSADCAKGGHGAYTSSVDLNGYKSGSAVFLVCLVITSSLWSSAIIVLVLAMIDVDLLGVMAILDIQLYPVFVVSHGDRSQRAKEVLRTMGSSVLGITLTKLVGVIVLYFAKSEIFVVLIMFGPPSRSVPIEREQELETSTLSRLTD
ncbi:unnamed protein product [Camellia sinensis]